MPRIRPPRETTPPEPEAPEPPKLSKAEAFEANKWKPGQSGNPAGRPFGSRHRFSEDFLRDFHQAWVTFGKAALETMAMLNSAEFVRAAVALVPRETHATITKINLDRMSSDELRAILEEAGSQDPPGSPAHPEILQ